jgi:predicted DNA-binding protein YlxM (UPF0122 family)
MKTIKPEKVDVHHYPFRGIYTEIAREEGVTRQAIQQAAEKGNPRILGRIAQKIEERKALLKKYNKAGSARKQSRQPRAKPPDEAGKADDP